MPRAANAGLVEPVKGGVEAGMRLGVGKAEEDEHFTAAENVVRKRLDIEVAADEDAEQSMKREVRAAGSTSTSTSANVPHNLAGLQSLPSFHGHLKMPLEHHWARAQCPCTFHA